MHKAIRLRRAKRVAAQHSLRSRLSLESLEARHMLAADMVIQWNDIALEATQADVAQANPGASSHHLAMMHAAVFDAVNAITKNYTHFALTLEVESWASQEAAVATAARDVLVALYPEQTAFFNTKWAQSLASIPNGAAEDRGVFVGHEAATAVLGLRADDGSTSIIDYTVATAPGHWQPDPLHPDQLPWGPEWGSVAPMSMDATSDFSVPPPPALNSQAYADAYNEVKAYGALNSAVRTEEQTEIGLFWAYDRAGIGPPTVLYNEAVQEISQLKGNSLEDNARLFAMVNIAMADAGVAGWAAKFQYDFWRPITAIRAGHLDGNAQTTADTNWVPLGAPGADPNSSSDDFTPPFPAYTSGHASFGAAAFRTLAHFYGSDEFEYSLESEDLPGVVRHFTSFSEAAEENAISRIYLGIHWRFDADVGVDLGYRIADDMYGKMFLPRGESTLTMVELQRVGGGYQAVSLPQGTNISITSENGIVYILNADTDVVLFAQPANEIAQIRIDGRNQETDLLTIDLSNGATLPQSIVIEVVGDEDWFDGISYRSSGTHDRLELHDDQFVAVGVTPVVYLYGIGYVSLDAGAGDNQLVVTGDQHGRQVDLDGGNGSDKYELYAHGAEYYIGDSGGLDFLTFWQATSSVVCDLSLNRGQVQQAAGSTLRLWGDLEVLTGSAFDDFLYGNHLDNYIEGFFGNDFIDGKGGSDWYLGGDGNDFLYVAGNMSGETTRLQGHEGSDKYELYAYGAQYELIDTGGLDFITFWQAPASVSCDLAFANGELQHVAGGTLQIWGDLEVLTGSAFDDFLYGNHFDNYIEGFHGNDYIDGRGRSDWYLGGFGNDHLFVSGNKQGSVIHLDGQIGDDIYDIAAYGGVVHMAESGGYDMLMFWKASNPVTFDLSLNNGQQQAQAAANYLYVWGGEIEVLVGSYFDDRLYGNSLSNVIDGYGGNDLIYGRDGHDDLRGKFGDDVLIGGNGDDLLHGDEGRDVLIGGFGKDYLYGDAQDDILIGGRTSHDHSEIALLAIIAEWASPRSGIVRQRNLEMGTGSADRLNGNYYLRQYSTVFDDGVFDVLDGGGNYNWLI